MTYPTGIMNVTLGGIFQIVCEPKGDEKIQRFLQIEKKSNKRVVQFI